MKEILCLVEHEGGKIRDITFEILACGRELAERLSLAVTACLLAGDDRLLSEISEEADETIFAFDPIFNDFNSEIYCAHLVEILRERSPDFVLIGSTAAGVEIGPYLAARLSYGFIPDCAGYEFSDTKLYFLRDIYGGKIVSSLLSPKERILLTLRSGSFKPKERRKSAGKVTQLKLKPGVYKTRFLGYKEAALGEVDITRADVVVGVGRGIRSKDNFPLVEEFAREIGGVIGCSRPIIDYGWLPKDRLIGSSGKTIKPKIYIALGISGTFQHISGIKDAETIIAINKDSEAPIFSVAHYGVVGDLLKILPVMKEKIMEIKAQG